jgi:hypothetical protein
MSIISEILAPEEVVQKRLEICDGCEHKKLGICTKCGCIIAAKTRSVHAECPLQKWQKYRSDQT